ncbi:PREDICTED: G-type lectin S-receptor-like serine/threonine-protein kinase At4g27290 [Ipomoea nil]|uniref:G-type lectin S-receptor-like serine/threonine-protein kinase At4g27290 n=1 Tax=Ipomoea nil TaxID=35883 RepID=UPI000901E4ED|nr:PREDICTED: G-type lectin S-receptor-like serine/threonine-protein kinase At4g27290 [Ipomoea nil]
MGSNLLLFIALMPLVSIQKISSARDAINSTDFLRDGDTIVSSGGVFEMGFFSPNNSLNRYVGIWYKQLPIRTVVWVANRDAPITNKYSVVLQMFNPGGLALVGGNNSIFWHTNTSNFVQNPVARLLDSGNLVITDANDSNPENFLWQSFHHPTDTLLPGMMFGKNFLTGIEIILSSWKTENNPGSGEYKLLVEPTGYPQVLIKRGREEVFRSGPWNGLEWNGSPGMEKLEDMAEMGAIANATAFYAYYKVFKTSKLIRLIISTSGNIQFYLWADGSQEWKIVFTAPTDTCDRYGYCGAYSICYYDYYPACGCLDKFLPKNPVESKSEYLGAGCVRRTRLNCQNASSDGFIKYSGVKLPDTKFSWFNSSMSLQECEQVCLKNCNCTAYSNMNISNGENNGCLLWFGDLIDLRLIPEKEQDLFIRMASSDLDYTSSSKSKKFKKLKVTSSLLIVLLALSLTMIMILYKRKGKVMEPIQPELLLVEDQTLFEASTIIRATDNFSLRNKIGEGGYGPVYKGVLDDGREIAVKRLSKNSMQGIEEFKNEVNFIAKLQHRNLVSLIGWCIKGEEKMLIYEYMPNKSLDSFIFGILKSSITLLNWTKRFNIINGIARGLLYLHQDSRLRVIHRDLKASNILLDIDMNPKISDFGLARSIGGNEFGANTSRVAGTHGYMSPEYAGNGMFSTKSDVFSFGVSVLEIVSGKRNRGFSHQEYYENLPSYAWKLYKDGRSIELLDENLVVSCNLTQVLRSIQVGLLCVQQHPEDRPNMYSVVQMLSSDAELPIAKEPGFFTGRAIETQRMAVLDAIDMVLGGMVTMDDRNFDEPLCVFYRICVTVDITKSLKKGMKLKMDNGDWATIDFSL